MDKVKIVLDALVLDGCIPVDGMFEITENLLKAYTDKYDELFSTTGLKKTGEIKYARKMAGIKLLELNWARGAKTNDIKAGLVYMISNPVFPGYVKIGMTINLPARLNSYQTCDPFRKFRVEKYEFVINRLHVEEQLLKHPDIFRGEGEWVKEENAKEVFSKITTPMRIQNIMMSKQKAKRNKFAIK